MKPFLLIFSSLTFLVSCQKKVDLQDLTNPQPGGGNSGGNSGGNNNSIIGKWNLVGITAFSKTTITAGTGIDE